MSIKLGRPRQIRHFHQDFFCSFFFAAAASVCENWRIFFRLTFFCYLCSRVDDENFDENRREHFCLDLNQRHLSVVHISYSRLRNIRRGTPITFLKILRKINHHNA